MSGEQYIEQRVVQRVSMAISGIEWEALEIVLFLFLSLLNSLEQSEKLMATPRLFFFFFFLLIKPMQKASIRLEADAQFQFKRL